MNADSLRQRLDSARLYAFVDAGFLRNRPAQDAAKALCDGGADVIQLRAKGMPEYEVCKLAESVAEVTHASKVLLVINDYPAIARRVNANLCHMGQEDFFDAGFRKSSDVPGAGAAFGLGLSTHSPAQAARSLTADPSYIAIGPVYATGTKPTAPPVTLDYVRWAAREVTIPWFAIGGITLSNLDEVIEAGARRVCVVSAILCQEDISSACQAFRNRLVSAAR